MAPDTAAIRTSADAILSRISQRPAVGVVLGSGLGDFADALPKSVSIPTSEIPAYPVSTVHGHKGRLVFAEIDAVPIVAFQGRIHFYESRDLKTVLHPIHVAHEIGIRTLLVTNAAGGLNRTFLPGDLMLITDHINFTLLTQRSAANQIRSAPVYSPTLIRKAESVAEECGIPVRKGVYVGLQGPTYETASEVEMVGRLGGDAVGMSTVFEASLASQLGMEVLGISCITNLGTGISPTKLSHDEVTEVGNRVKHTFASLLRNIIKAL